MYQKNPFKPLFLSSKRQGRGFFSIIKRCFPVVHQRMKKPSARAGGLFYCLIKRMKSPLARARGLPWCQCIDKAITSATAPPIAPRAARATPSRKEMGSNLIIGRHFQGPRRRGSALPVYPPAGVAHRRNPTRPPRLGPGHRRARHRGLPRNARRRQRVCTFARCRACLLYTSPSPRDRTRSRMPSSA